MICDRDRSARTGPNRNGNITRNRGLTEKVGDGTATFMPVVA